MTVNSYLKAFIELDVQVSRHLAVCSSATSSLGHVRPLAKLLEYSCHGVPWFVGTALALLASHQSYLHIKLINQFYGEQNKYYFW